MATDDENRCAANKNRGGKTEQQSAVVSHDKAELG